MTVNVDLDAELRQLAYKIEHMTSRIGKYGVYRAGILREIGKACPMPARRDELEIMANSLSDTVSSFDPSYGIVADLTSAISDVLYFPKRELHAGLTQEQRARKMGELSAHIRNVNRLAKVIKFKLLKVDEINELFNTEAPDMVPEVEAISRKDFGPQLITPYIDAIAQHIDELGIKLDEFQKTLVVDEQSAKYAFAFELGEISVIMHELFEAEGKGRACSGSPDVLYEQIQESLVTMPEESLEVLAVKKFVGEADNIHLEKTFDNLWAALNNIRKELYNIENVYNDKKTINVELITRFVADAKSFSEEISDQVRELKKIDLKLKPPLKDMHSDVGDTIKKVDARLSSVKSANNLINDALEAVEKTVYGWAITYAQE
ncbi:MAG: hypothetical protein LBI79_07935 [Nitrososphaerota archaeon]|jgi:hypothetical protein|nr:hypothetical protein [Nitrososphaerota archaeon]